MLPEAGNFMVSFEHCCSLLTNHHKCKVLKSAIKNVKALQFVKMALNCHFVAVSIHE